MKLEAPIKINVSALKNDVGVNVSIDQVRDDLQSMGAEVTGDKEPDGTLVMYIGGDIEYSDIETCFDEINVDVDDYIIEDDTDELVNECDLGEADELGECDKYPTYESALEKFKNNKKLDEKKKDCCPKKKVNENKTSNEQKSRFRGNAIPLSEALNGDYKKITKKHTLNDIIDSMTGRTEQRKINQKAIQKAMNESKTAELSEQLGQEKSQKIIDAIKNGRKTMYEKVSINKKAMVDYTVEELTAICEKLEGQIATLKEKNEGLNEADSAKIQNQISKKEHLIEMIHDEIDFRNALQEANDEDLFGDAFPNMNPNVENNDNEEDKKDDEKPENADEEKSKDSEEKKDDEDNPDEDKKVEIGSIVVTLDSKEHAEDLKTDLLDAGVPEEAIEISPAKIDDEEESEDENKDEDTAENDEEKSEDNAEESGEKQEESAKTDGNKLNEEDEEHKSEDAPAEDAPADDNAEGGEDENKEEDAEAEGAYTLTLVDTNYAEKLQDVFNDVYGITPEEFSDMIGGDIVGTTEDENGESEEDKSDEDNKDAEGDDNVEKKDGDDVEELDPDDIFKDL